MKLSGFFLLEGLISVAIFSLVSGIICFYLMQVSHYIKRAQETHAFIQYIRNPVEQKTALNKKYTIEHKKITVPTPIELRSIVKNPITLGYKKIMTLPVKKEQGDVLYVF